MLSTASTRRLPMGRTVGLLDGLLEGVLVGRLDGVDDGFLEGRFEGFIVKRVDGLDEGLFGFIDGIDVHRDPPLPVNIPVVLAAEVFQQRV
jgi:hypothetical protein